MVGVDKERVQVAVPRRVPPEHVDVAVLVRVLADLAPLLVAPGVPVHGVKVPPQKSVRGHDPGNGTQVEALGLSTADP